MRVRVILTIGDKETLLEGQSEFFDHPSPANRWHLLERKGLGFWLNNWSQAGCKPHKSGAFIPWTSCLFVEEIIIKEVKNE